MRCTCTCRFVDLLCLLYAVVHVHHDRVLYYIARNRFDRVRYKFPHKFRLRETYCTRRPVRRTQRGNYGTANASWLRCSFTHRFPDCTVHTAALRLQLSPIVNKKCGLRMHKVSTKNDPSGRMIILVGFWPRCTTRNRRSADLVWRLVYATRCCSFLWWRSSCSWKCTFINYSQALPSYWLPPCFYAD